jgi:hypothetical protein
MRKDNADTSKVFQRLLDNFWANFRDPMLTASLASHPQFQSLRNQPVTIRDQQSQQ